MESEISKSIHRISNDFFEQIGQATDGLYLFHRAALEQELEVDKMEWLSELSYQSAVKANNLFRELLAIAEKLTEERIFAGDVREYNSPHRNYFKVPGKKAEVE
ncbi:MAG: hypothetical protein HQK60_20305 [Deltaproteobacteria bacterium]|nr:hypothetical protein [Deltaproteobacteria bacterium]